MGQVATLEEEGSALSDQVTGQDSESEVEAVGGINVIWLKRSADTSGKSNNVSCVGRQAFRSRLPPPQGI